MFLLDRTLPTLFENLALDEALLLEAEAGGPEVLRLWEWPSPAVVIGAGGRLQDEVHVDACDRDGVPIARRSSGGGAVMLSSGCLLYSLVLRFERDPALPELQASFRWILGRLQAGLKRCSNSMTLQGSSDLAIEGRKVSGNAQQRKRTHLLHHGTLLHAFDAVPLDCYLKMPPWQPEYRRQRGHAEFLTNLPMAGAALRVLLCNTWQAHEALVDWPAERTQQLVAKRYGHDTWIRRR